MKRQADGRYKSKVIVGTRGDGSKVTKYITAKTKRELEAKRREALVDYRDGTARETSDVMAMDWIYKWYDTVAAPHQKEQTARDIRSQIARYIEPALADKWKYVRELLGDDVTTRTFRNNFATVLYDAGVDVLTASKVMGHADPTTTLKIYTDLERSRKVKKGNESIRAAFEK